MDQRKVETFIQLAGQAVAQSLHAGTPEQRKLGAQLLLSELLEYIIYGLGIRPVVRGVEITDPEQINYVVGPDEPSKLEMIDGLADVAYTMYWNAVTFGIPVEQAYQLVCDNNLEKFVRLDGWSGPDGQLPRDAWGLQRGITWPDEVASVEVVQVGSQRYAVGKDQRGKVRKPSSYKPVELSGLLGTV